MRISVGVNVPEGWRLLPLKRITRFGYGDTLASDERERRGVKVYGSNGPFDEHSEANTLAPCIIVGRKGSYGKLNFSNDPVFAVDTTFVIDQRHTSADLRFLYYSLGILGLDELSDDIAVPGLSRERAYQALSLLPPPDTQRKIARFLDEKTARIDGLIEKKQELLDRLAEKRQALIIRAVTNGLNPDVPMKRSGIDWLGDIPAHWEVFLIKRHFEVRYGIGGEIDRSLEEGTQLLSLPNITKEGRFCLDEVPFTDAATPDDMLREGDLLFNWRNGSSQHLGKTVRFDLPGSWSHVSFLLRLRARHPQTYSGFLRYFVNGLRETEFFAYAKAGVNNTFNLFEVSNLPVVSPPEWAEQYEIASYLDKKTGELDVAFDRITESLLSLEEYRATLVTAAVTGQIAGLM